MTPKDLPRVQPAPYNEPVPAPLLYRVRAAAVFDVGGPDREAFLQGQITQDVRLAASGGALPAAGLSPKGKLIFVACHHPLVEARTEAELVIKDRPSGGETVLTDRDSGEYQEISDERT